MMPKRDRFIQGLVLAGGGAIIAAGATAPAQLDSKQPTNETVVVEAGHGVHIKKPPNGG